MKTGTWCYPEPIVSALSQPIKGFFLSYLKLISCAELCITGKSSVLLPIPRVLLLNPASGSGLRTVRARLDITRQCILKKIKDSFHNILSQYTSIFVITKDSKYPPIFRDSKTLCCSYFSAFSPLSSFPYGPSKHFRNSGKMSNSLRNLFLSL